MKKRKEIAKYLSIAFLALGLIAASTAILPSPTRYDPGTQAYLNAKQPLTTQMLIRTHWNLIWAVAGASLGISAVCAFLANTK